METKQDRFTKIKSRVAKTIVLDGSDTTLTDRSIAYCIGYGAAKCLNDEYVVNYPPPKGGELRVVPSTPSFA